MGLERIEPLDWRYSAAIVGLKEYLTGSYKMNIWNIIQNLLQSQII